MKKPSSRRWIESRDGFSLVEMLVVIALSSLLFSIVLSLMFGLRQWDHVSRTTSVRNEQLLRLAGVLRSDIRQGADVLLSVEGRLVVMTASGEQLRYELDSEGCRRTVVATGAAHSSVDVFAIGKAAKWIVARKAMGRRSLVAVTLEQPTPKNEPTSPRMMPFIVYAALGGDVFQRATANDEL